MGWLFSNTRTSISNNSRSLHRTECPDEPDGRDRVINELSRRGHRVTGYLSHDNNYQPMPEELPRRRKRW